MLKNIEYLLAEGLWAHISFIQMNIQILTQHQRSNSMDVQTIPEKKIRKSEKKLEKKHDV